MRIMVVHNRYRSASPSGENRVVDREREALAGRGHEVIRFERNSDEIEQWPVLRKAALPGRIIWNREARRDLQAQLRARRPDVVHMHNTFPLLSPAVLYACRDESVPVVITLHNYRLMCASRNFFRDGAVCRDCVDGPAIQAVVHGCYKHSRLATATVVLANSAHRKAWKSLVSAYIFISAAQRDLLADLDLDPDRVFVRHNLIPRRGIRQASPGHNVIYAGRLDEAKGVRLLMAGWDRYLAGPDQPGLRLIIAGTGILQPEVAAWAATRPSVHLAGHLDEDQCTDLMSRARAVILPSAWAEPFGLVAVEAMAAGVPAIAAAHGALTELITPSVDGTLFPPGDPHALATAIADVDANPGRYRAYGETARETYHKRFDPDNNLDQLLDIYRSAMTNPVSQPRDGATETPIRAEPSIQARDRVDTDR
jgi:glycosyltransferase involved in cell wall biosynthesis